MALTRGTWDPCAEGSLSHSIPPPATPSYGVLVSHVLLFVTPWTVARQAALFVGFSRQEYWSGLPSPGEKIPFSRGSPQPRGQT